MPKPRVASKFLSNMYFKDVVKEMKRMGIKMLGNNLKGFYVSYRDVNMLLGLAYRPNWERPPFKVVVQHVSNIVGDQQSRLGVVVQHVSNSVGDQRTRLGVVVQPARNNKTPKSRVSLLGGS